MKTKIATAIGILVVAFGVTGAVMASQNSNNNGNNGNNHCQHNCATPTPTPTPSPSPKPCKGDEDRICPSPTPSPSPDPTPIVEASPEASTSGGNITTPQCADGNTLNLPANVQVERKGDKATVSWFKTEGDNATIFYKEVHSGNWQHSVFDIKTTGLKDNFVSVTINDLDPNLGYTFGVEQRQGCGGGQTVSSVVIDGPEEHIFKFSYWEWNK